MRKERDETKKARGEELRGVLGGDALGTESGSFVVEAKKLGLRPGLDYSNIEELLERAEGFEHR